jgi:hypothetical protein
VKWPIDYGIGRSPGGLSSKVHQLVDSRGRPLVVLVGPGQAHDSPMFPVLLSRSWPMRSATSWCCWNLSKGGYVVDDTLR